MCESYSCEIKACILEIANLSHLADNNLLIGRLKAETVGARGIKEKESGSQLAHPSSELQVDMYKRLCH